MTSINTFPRRFTQIDELSRQDHPHLSDEDDCFFLGEYTAYKDTAHKGFAYSKTNSLISNFKKSVDTRGEPQWNYKIDAISKIAKAFRNALRPEKLGYLTFVPIPPSKAKTDHLYDDRLIKMLQKISPTQVLDVREIIVQKTSTIAAHESEERPTPAQIEQFYEFKKLQNKPTPELIAIVDDVLTTGAHFIAVKNILSKHFPKVGIFGLFIARRVPGTTDFSDFDW